MELEAGRIYEKLYVKDSRADGQSRTRSYLDWHF